MIKRLCIKVASMVMGGKIPEVYIARLPPDVYKTLVARVNGTCQVTAATTELQAGYQLGMQHVLNAVAEGFTLSRT